MALPDDNEFFNDALCSYRIYGFGWWFFCTVLSVSVKHSPWFLQVFGSSFHCWPELLYDHHKDSIDDKNWANLFGPYHSSSSTQHNAYYSVLSPDNCNFFCYLSVIGVHLESTTSHRYWAVSHLAFIPRDIIAEDQLWITACFIDWNSCYRLNRSLDSCQWSAAATLCFIGGSARLKLEAICANTLLLIETGGKHNGWTLTVNPTMNSMNPNYKASSPPVKVHSVLCF